MRIDLLVLFASLFFLACGSDEPAAMCIDSSGCPSGQRCVDGECAISTGMDGSTDSSRTDSGGADGGPACTPTDCDDGNECTDDRCTETGCENTNNTSACDDGSFCNGPDSCMGGSCSVNAGDPCGGLTCDETMGTCEGTCTTNADCPGDVVGAWASCMGFADMCDETGTRTREVASFTCMTTTSTCVATAATESEACMRGTSGTVCDDGDDCTRLDRCSGGTCNGEDLFCPPGCSCGTTGRICVDDRTGNPCREF